jgi:hypothetical protein
MPSARPWSAGSRSASTAAWCGCRGASSKAAPGAAHPPEGLVGAGTSQRTRFETIAERKLRRGQLTEDGNLEIRGRDLRQLPIADVRRASPKPPQSTLSGHSGAPSDGLYLGIYYGLYGIADVTTLTGTEVTGK